MLRPTKGHQRNSVFLHAAFGVASGMNFQANIERFTGFADHYDGFRPSPPEPLSVLLSQMAETTQPALVVDLGCGTGLSTRLWKEKTRRVVGVDPTASMLEQARRLGGGGISYREGFSHATGLPDGCADIVTCCQSLHWMEPEATFREVARILRPGGVFAACDYRWPPVTTSPTVDRAYLECEERARGLEQELGVSAAVRKWDKAGHLPRMQESGYFSWVRECTLHHVDLGNAERLIGLLLSQGHIQTLRKHSLGEQELGIDRLRALADRHLGSELRQWFWSSTVRVGLTDSGS